MAAMVHDLQQSSRDGEAEWQLLEPALDWCVEPLAPDDTLHSRATVRLRYLIRQ